jgi:hypothetical protein
MPIRAQRASNRLATFFCPLPNASHSSGVMGVQSVVCTACRTSRIVIAFAFVPRPDFGGPIVKRGFGGPETMTGQGNLSERRMSREVDGVVGSVAGCESVCAGIAVCVARSRTVRAEGEKATSYVIGALCRRVYASNGCICRVVGRWWTYAVGWEWERERLYVPSTKDLNNCSLSERDHDLHEDVLPTLPVVCQLWFVVSGGRVSA